MTPGQRSYQTRVSHDLRLQELERQLQAGLPRTKLHNKKARKNFLRNMRYANDPAYRRKLCEQRNKENSSPAAKRRKRLYDAKYARKNWKRLRKYSREYYYKNWAVCNAKRSISQATTNKIGHKRASLNYARKHDGARRLLRSLGLAHAKKKAKRGYGLTINQHSIRQRKLGRRAVAIVQALGYVWKGNTWRLP